MSNGDVPAVVQVKTGDHPHRYETVQRAKEVFGVGNNKDAILAACEHARRDLEAKREAAEWAERNLPGEQRDELLEILSTPDMNVSVEATTLVETR